MKVQRCMPGNPEVKKWYPALAPLSVIGIADVIEGIVGKCTLTSPDIKVVTNDLHTILYTISRGG